MYHLFFIAEVKTGVGRDGVIGLVNQLYLHRILKRQPSIHSHFFFLATIIGIHSDIAINPPEANRKYLRPVSHGFIEVFNQKTPLFNGVQ